jgi:drug/metabolite transporter (DMT)-like permease
MRLLTRPIGMVLTALFITFLWGSVAPAIKLGYQSLQIDADELGSQIVYAGYISLLAACMLFLILFANRQSIRLAPHLVWPVGKIAFFQIFINYLFFFIGVSISTGTVGSIMAGSTSFFQLLFAHFLYDNERLTPRKIVGLIIGLMGVVLINMSHLQLSVGWGESILLLSVMAGAWGNLLARTLAQQLDTILMTAYAFLFSAIGLLAFGTILVGELFPFDFTLRAGLILYYLGFLSAIALLLWNQLMKLYPISQVSLFLFLIPVFGVFISAFVLDEQVGIITLVPLLLVVSGIFVINRNQRAQN